MRVKRKNNMKAGEDALKCVSESVVVTSLCVEWLPLRLESTNCTEAEEKFKQLLSVSGAAAAKFPER